MVCFQTVIYVDIFVYPFGPRVWIWGVWSNPSTESVFSFGHRHGQDEPNEPADANQPADGPNKPAHGPNEPAHGPEQRNPEKRQVKGLGLK